MTITAIEGPHRQRLFEAKLAKIPANAREAHLTPAEKRTGGQQELVAQSESKVAVSATEIAKALTADEKAKLDELQRKLKGFDNKKPPAPPVAMGLTDGHGPPPKTFLLERGELSNKGAEVQPGFPSILAQAASRSRRRFPRCPIAQVVASRWRNGSLAPTTR